MRERFDPKDDAEWLELVRDVIAMANTGGGVVLLGTAGVDLTELSERVERYAGVPFRDLDVETVARNGRSVAAVVVGPAEEAPLVFVRPGSSDRRVYFRHGGKSVPATSADLRAFVERRVNTIRRQWLGNIRQVMTGRGAQFAVVEASEDGEPTLIRLTDDPSAPLYGKLDVDQTHPFRQKEVVAEVNAHLPQGVSITPYDVLSVRRVHDISEETHPEFAHTPKFGTTQYSEAFVDWLLEQYETDPDFFADAKARYTATIRRRRRSSQS